MFKFINDENFVLIIIVIGLFGIIMLILCAVPAIQNQQIIYIFFRTLGISVLTTLVITILWNYRLEKYFLEKIAKYLKLSTACNIIGILDVYIDRVDATPSIIECLNNYGKELKILGGSLTFFFSSNESLKLSNLIEHNLKNEKFSIKALLPVETSLGLKIRGNDKINGLSNIDTLRGCLKVAKELKEKYPTKFDYHTYTNDPSCFLVLTEDILFLEPYDLSSHGWASPVFKCKNSGSFYKRYVKHFNYIWKYLCIDVSE